MEEKKVISDFIELYRNSPCLWDFSCEQYKDNLQTNMAWDVLVEKLKEIEPNANVVSAKKKIENLKTSYRREVNKIKESKRKSGSNSKHVHQPSLWYFKLMTFLDKRDHQIRSGIDTLSSDDEPPRRRKKSNKIMEKRKEKHSNSFAVYVGEQLDSMSIYQRHVAEKLIADVIYLARMDNLSYDSRIESNPRCSPLNSPSPQFVTLPYNSPPLSIQIQTQQSDSNHSFISIPKNERSPQSDSHKSPSPQCPVLKEMLLTPKKE